MPVAEYNVLVEEPVAASVALRSDGRPVPPRKMPARDVLARISTKDLCRTTRQLATLLRAGMPVVPALSALVEQLQATGTPRGDARPSSADAHCWLGVFHLGLQTSPLAEVMAQVRDDVNAGSTLSGALAMYPDVFSSVFINMVAAGQASGALEDVLLRLAEMLEKRVRLAGKIQSVIAYPLMMAVVAVGVVVFLLSFVVPSITRIFLEMNRQLPWPTSLLISICSFMKTYWLLFPAAIVAAFFAAAAWLKTKEGRITWDRSKLKLPLFGKLLLKLEIARLARTLGVLLASGIPILQALEIVNGVVQNRFIADALNSVRDWVGKGDNIAEAIKRTSLFPPIVVHIIATGQVSGSIEEGLMNIADMYDDEVELTSRTLTSLLEPAILLFMGAVIGFIVLAVLLPIFDINQVI